MGDPAAFVKARLGDTEAWAQARLEGLPHEYVGDVTPEQALAMHVLATVEAHRAILAVHAPDSAGNCYACVTTRDRWQEDWPLDRWPCQTVLAIAAIWSYHPDYADAVAQQP